MESRQYTFNNSTLTVKFGNILDTQAEVIVSSDDCYVTMGDYSVLYPNLIRLKKNGKWGCCVINRKKWLGEGIAYTAIYIFNNKIVAEKENGHKIELQTFQAIKKN